MIEEWENVGGYPSYQVSNLGRVRSLKFNKELVLKFGNNGGYLHFSLYKNGIKTIIKVHRLVLMTFKPISNPELYQCNHIDGNKSNNNIDNLEWCTCSENANHAFKIGLRKSLKGKDHHFYGRIFTDEEKKNLSEKLKGEKHPFYGKQFSNETKNKMSENHVDVKGENNSAHKLVELEVIEVRKLLKEKILTQKEIAKMFNIIQSTVSGIKLRKTWSHIKEEDEENV